ncbi:MAG: biotin/lipoyl-binding protein [Planctomycetota bacterium]
MNIAPQVAGDVVSVLVQEQMPVKAGEVLAIVDPTIYQREVNLAAARLQVTEAALAKSQADLALLVAQVPKRIAISGSETRHRANNESRATDALRMTTADVDKEILAATHAVDAAQATFVLSEEDYVRYAALFKDQAVPSKGGVRRSDQDLQDRAAAPALPRLVWVRRKLIAIKSRSRSNNYSRPDSRSWRTEFVELSKLGNLEIAPPKDSWRSGRNRWRRHAALLDLSSSEAGVHASAPRMTASSRAVMAPIWRLRRDGRPIFSMCDPNFLYVTVHLEETRLGESIPVVTLDWILAAYPRPFAGRVIWIRTTPDVTFRSHSSRRLFRRGSPSCSEFPSGLRSRRTNVGTDSSRDCPFGVAIEHGDGDADWAKIELERLVKARELARVKETRP